MKEKRNTDRPARRPREQEESGEGRVTLPQVKQRTGMIIFAAAAAGTRRKRGRVSAWRRLAERNNGGLARDAARDRSDLLVVIAHEMGLWAGWLGLGYFSA